MRFVSGFLSAGESVQAGKQKAGGIAPGLLLARLHARCGLLDVFEHCSSDVVHHLLVEFGVHGQGNDPLH